MSPDEKTNQASEQGKGGNSPQTEYAQKALDDIRAAWKAAEAARKAAEDVLTEVKALAKEVATVKKNQERILEKLSQQSAKSTDASGETAGSDEGTLDQRLDRIEELAALTDKDKEELRELEKTIEENEKRKEALLKKREIPSSQQ